MGVFDFKAAARESPGFHFGKPDMERLGLFTEPGYLRMVDAKPKKTAPPKLNNPPMVLPGPKIKCGLGDGYFDPEFRRIFIKEAINWRPKPKKKNEKAYAPIIPVGPTKKHSTPGDNFGCFVRYTAMDNRSKPTKKKKDQKVLPNCQVAYPGYFSKFPEYKPEGVPKKKKPPTIFTLPVMVRGMHGNPYFWDNPYKEPREPRKPIYVQPKPPKITGKGGVNLGGPWMPVGPGKLLQGCKAGGFERWPAYKPVLLRKVKKVVQEYGYGPQSYGAKSIFTPSIVNMCVDISTNAKTQATMQPKHVTRYLIPTV